jgi:hypothetical protein
MAGATSTWFAGSRRRVSGGLQRRQLGADLGTVVREAGAAAFAGACSSSAGEPRRVVSYEPTRLEGVFGGPAA